MLNLALASAGAAYIYPPPEPDLDQTIDIVSDVVVSEPSSGTATVRFHVKLSGVISQPVTVAYATADGTARAALGDYVATAGSLTFQPSTFTSQSKSIAVTIKADSVAELDETFFVNLSLGPTDEVWLGDGQGKGTIRGSSGSGASDDYCDRYPSDPRCQPVIEPIELE